jgi:hypothetical protein
VAARRGSRGYRLRKFVRRNSLQVVLAGAAAAVAGIGGVAAYQARASRKRARQAALPGRLLRDELAAAHRLLNNLQAHPCDARALQGARDWLRATLRKNGADTELRRQLEAASAALDALAEGHARRP